jgi:hypothetical protein
VSRFVDEAIAKAGLSPVRAAHEAGDVDTLRATVASWGKADLLVLGAVADAVRADDVGTTVQIHEGAAGDDPQGHVTWVTAPPGASELEFLRAVAVARIAAKRGARIGVDWSERGVELAQVALGFGASDLRGPITRKSGLPILEGERLKLKGQGMVELRSIKKRDLAALVTHAGREPVFVEDERADSPRTEARDSSHEVASV